jgi:GTP diphosphokinase / guanosine-3',5'-bis(diphosphate) 3'-diphosphatase
MLGVAIAFAAEAHRDQRDKRGEVYFLHPMRVLLALQAIGYPEAYQVAAVLHDVVEDTEATLEEIHERFGSLVGDAVDALTRRGHWEPQPDQDEAKWIWEETYKEYIRRCCQNSIARAVKRFDVYDNFDPRRYCEGVPVGRYVWTLEYLKELDETGNRS